MPPRGYKRQSDGKFRLPPAAASPEPQEYQPRPWRNLQPHDLNLNASNGIAYVSLQMANSAAFMGPIWPQQPVLAAPKAPVRRAPRKRKPLVPTRPPARRRPQRNLRAPDTPSLSPSPSPPPPPKKRRGRPPKVQKAGPSSQRAIFVKQEPEDEDEKTPWLHIKQEIKQETKAEPKLEDMVSHRLLPELSTQWRTCMDRFEEREVEFIILGSDDEDED